MCAKTIVQHTQRQAHLVIPADRCKAGTHTVMARSRRLQLLGVGYAVSSAGLHARYPMPGGRSS